MKKLENEYISSGWHPDYTFTPRDSRYVYGHRYAVEKRNRDWLWMAGTVAASVVLAVVYVWLRG